MTDVILSMVCAFSATLFRETSCVSSFVEGFVPNQRHMSSTTTELSFHIFDKTHLFFLCRFNLRPRRCQTFQDANYLGFGATESSFAETCF